MFQHYRLGGFTEAPEIKHRIEFQNCSIGQIPVINCFIPSEDDSSRELQLRYITTLLVLSYNL